MPLDEAGQGRAQGRHVQLSGEGDPQGDVEDLGQEVFGVHRGETGLLSGGGCPAFHRAGFFVGLGFRARRHLARFQGQLGRHGP